MWKFNNYLRNKRIIAFPLVFADIQKHKFNTVRLLVAFIKFAS